MIGELGQMLSSAMATVSRERRKASSKRTSVGAPKRHKKQKKITERNKFTNVVHLNIAGHGTFLKYSR